jgi:hypothetical protein
VGGIGAASTVTGPTGATGPSVTGTVLVGGRYGYGTDAESYVVGEPIVVYVASGDEWEKAA